MYLLSVGAAFCLFSSVILPCHKHRASPILIPKKDLKVDSEKSKKMHLALSKCHTYSSNFINNKIDTVKKFVPVPSVYSQLVQNLERKTGGCLGTPLKTFKNLNKSAYESYCEKSTWNLKIYQNIFIVEGQYSFPSFKSNSNDKYSNFSDSFYCIHTQKSIRNIKDYKYLH